MILSVMTLRFYFFKHSIGLSLDFKHNIDFKFNIALSLGLG